MARLGGFCQSKSIVKEWKGFEDNGCGWTKWVGLTAVLKSQLGCCEAIEKNVGKQHRHVWSAPAFCRKTFGRMEVLKVGHGSFTSPSWISIRHTTILPSILDSLAILKTPNPREPKVFSVTRNTKTGFFTSALSSPSATAEGGFMQGFFGPGMSATITTPEEPATWREGSEEVVRGIRCWLLRTLWVYVGFFLGFLGFSFLLFFGFAKNLGEVFERF